MREEDTLSVLVELDNLEVEFLANSDGRLVFLLEVTGGAEAFYSVVEGNNGALVGEFGNRTLVD